MRLEPMLNLLEIAFDTNVARDMMTEKFGVATRVMYQLFVALNKKQKSNLTGVAMETMRPAAPVKLEGVESVLYREVGRRSGGCAITTLVFTRNQCLARNAFGIVLCRSVTLDLAYTIELHLSRIHIDHTEFQLCICLSAFANGRSQFSSREMSLTVRIV